MAVRKKSEAIHLRVSPLSKALLEGLANATGKTATQIIERSIIDESEKVSTLPDVIISEAFLDAKDRLQLTTALTSAHFPEEPILTKLRTFLIVDAALSERDRTIAKTIIEYKDRFSGETPIFSESDLIIRRDHLPYIPKVNLNEISKQIPTLEQYAIFKEKNPNIKAGYDDFLKMTGEE